MLPSKHEKSWPQASLWIITAIVGRIIPHPYNMTPLTSLALFSGFFFKRWHGLLLTLVSLAVSDSILAWMYGYPLIGSWSLFSYSGFLLMSFLASFGVRIPRLSRALGYTLVATLGYWTWTNFGTWLTGYGTYPHTLAGLTTCFMAGLPFLRNALIGSLAWSLCIYLLAYRLPKKQPAAI